MLPLEHTLTFIEAELPGADAWAGRHDVPLIWVPEGLELRVTLTQPETNLLFFLRGRLDQYRAVPPAWIFTDSAWTAEPRQDLFPKPAQTPFGASVFHLNPVICAPFNRLAYHEHSGPHNDWGGPSNWLTAGRPNEVRAHYLGDMLGVIHQHLQYSRGRMA